VAYRYRQHLQVILLAAALIAGRPLGSPGADTTLLASSLLLVLVGGALRSWAMGYHTWRRVKGKGRNLVTAGPYAITRNPLYLGSFFIGCGIAAMSGLLWLLAGFAAIFVFSHFCIIRWEEGRLAEEFGGSFRTYMAAVPRLFPGLRSARERSGRFDLSTMFRCMEPVKTLGFVAAVLVMALFKAKGWTLAQ
jgi:protein-S-isoprenylcysteine O-methyltransferase Ste14